MTNWTDEEFLQYCDTHSETPRCLFNTDQIFRLCDLAGVPRPNLYPDGWYSVDHWEVHPATKIARERLKANNS